MADMCGLPPLPLPTITPFLTLIGHSLLASLSWNFLFYLTSLPSISPTSIIIINVCDFFPFSVTRFCTPASSAHPPWSWLSFVAHPTTSHGIVFPFHTDQFGSSWLTSSRLSMRLDRAAPLLDIGLLHEWGSFSPSFSIPCLCFFTFSSEQFIETKERLVLFPSSPGPSSHYGVMLS